jgi:hypothetical protein
MSTGIVDVSLHPELSAELKDQVISYHKIWTTFSPETMWKLDKCQQ